VIVDKYDRFSYAEQTAEASDQKETDSSKSFTTGKYFLLRSRTASDSTYEETPGNNASY
jgi:hypothetical protein